MMNSSDRQYRKFLLWLLASVVLTGNVSVAVNALETTESNNQTRSLFYFTKSNKANRQTAKREYTFKAPNSKILSNPEQLTKIQGYTVEVYGSAAELLQQVKEIAPNAFINGEVIQVGIFSQQDNAEDLVRQLAIAGLWARIRIQ